MRWLVAASVVASVGCADLLDGGGNGPPQDDGPPATGPVVVSWTAQAHAGPVGQVAAQPGGGNLVAVADGATSIKLYDGTTLQRVDGGTMRHHPGADAAAFSPDGARLATGAYGGVRVWEVATETLVAELAPATDAAADALAWSPDGRYLAAGRRPGRGGAGEVGVVVWRVATGELVASVPTAGWVGGLAWSADGAFLAVSHGALTILDTEAWSSVVAADAAAERDGVRWHAGLQAFAFLAAGEVTSLAPAPTALPLVHASLEGAVAFALRPGTHELVIGTGAGEVVPLAPDGTPGSPLTTHVKAVTSFAWGEGGDVLFSGSRSGVVTRSVVSSGASISARVGSGRSHALGWSPDGSVVATGGDDGALRLWDVETGTLLDEVFAYEHGVSALDWHPNEATIATSGAYAVRLWDADGLELKDEAVHWVAQSDGDLWWSPDGTRLVAATGSSVDVFEGEGLAVVERVPRGSSAVAWSPGGDRIAVGAWWSCPLGYQPMEIVDLGGGPSSFLPLTDTQATAVAWDGDRVVSGNENWVVIWDGTTGVEVGRVTFTTFRARITSLAWSPDGRYLAIGGDHSYTHGASVVVWDSLLDEVFPAFDRATLGNTAGAVRWSRAGDRLAATDWSGELAVATFAP